MKILVIGGTGLIGSKVIPRLIARGHKVVSASPSTGVNTITGQGLDDAMAGTDVVVDVANAPSWEANAVVEFFETAGRNIAAAEKKAGVKHHVALSVVGTHKLADSPYFRGKIAQEKQIREAGVPYTIVQATQFFEFVGGIAQSAGAGQTIPLSSSYVQPISSDDVAEAVALFAERDPLNGITEIAGPDKIRLSELVSRFLADTKDSRTVVGDPKTSYFGANIDDTTLVPEFPHPWLGKVNYETWFASSKYAQK